MAVLVVNCPHCGAANMSFEVQAGVKHVNPCHGSVLATCGACDSPVVAMFEFRGYLNSASTILELHGNLLRSQSAKPLGLWPRPASIDIPLNCPEKVGRSFSDAAQSRKMKLWNPACASYRRCMELALKEFAPEVEAWKLEKRIDKLAADNKITPAIQQWAHELRLDGNEALHGDEDATEKITDQMHHLTYFLLTYLYTLPNQIQEVRNRRSHENSTKNG